jgi:hypothetical protein
MTSFISTETGFDLFLHIPMAGDDDYLDLYRMLPIPTQISPDSMMYFEPTRDIIAVSSDDKSFKTMDTAQLNRCKKAGSTYLCENGNVVRHVAESKEGKNGGSPEEDLCLYYLFTKNTQAAAETCPIHLRTPTDTAIQVGPTEFLLHNRVDTLINVKCGSAPTERIDVAQPIRKKFAPGCKITSDHYTAVASSDLQDSSPRLMVEYTWPVPLETLLEGINISHVEELRESMAKLRPVPTHIKGIREMVNEARRDAASQGSFMSTGLIISIVTACITVVIIIGGCCFKRIWARRALARAQRRAQVDTGFSQYGLRDAAYVQPPVYNPTFGRDGREDPETNPNTSWLTGK